MNRKKPELLCPAGDWERLQLAVAYGADAVYLAGTSFGMRAFAGNFTPEELPKVVQYAHDHGVKAHVTVNIMPRNDEAARLPAYLELLDKLSRSVKFYRMSCNMDPEAAIMSYEEMSGHKYGEE